jgi:hypothetical protein
MLVLKKELEATARKPVPAPVVDDTSGRGLELQCCPVAGGPQIYLLRRFWIFIYVIDSIVFSRRYSR